MKHNNILIVDDQEAVRTGARIVLANHGYEVLTAASPEAAMQVIDSHEIGLMLLDMNFQLDTTSGEEGLNFLRQLTRRNLSFPVVVMTAWSSVELAVKAMQLGAQDFLEKPWDNHRLLQIIAQQLKLTQVVEENHRLKAQQRSGAVPLLGDCAIMRQLLEQAEKVAATEANVLIGGENGTGKSLLASYIHQRSNRAKGSFVTVNIGAVPESLFESELFGHTKGAFTDAKENRMGRFEMARGGTLFLDEIGTMPLGLQPKLLRVLESGEFEPVGSSKTLQADTRLIAASNIDFEQAVAQGNFRRDLYYRLNTVELSVPPLRERIADILLLARHFLQQKARKYDKAGISLSAAAERRLTSYHWPGNVRELNHVIERALLFSETLVINADDLILAGGSEAPVSNLPLMTLDDAERKLIFLALHRTGSHVADAAALLGISQSAMYRRLEKYGIDPKQA